MRTVAVADDHLAALLAAGVPCMEMDAFMALQNRLYGIERHELDKMARWNDVVPDGTGTRDELVAALLSAAVDGRALVFSAPEPPAAEEAPAA